MFTLFGLKEIPEFFRGSLEVLMSLRSIIKDQVRLRLVNLKIKGSKHSVDAAKIWKFQVNMGNVDMHSD